MKNTYVKWAFIIPLLWWIYLFFTTQIVVVFDAASYEDLGKMIVHQGWGEFFRTGPNREPLFPAMVAWSMQLGEWWGIAYYYPLKMIGTLFLLLTMVFSYRLMRMLSIPRIIACLAVFYLGVSPVMTNSSMRLWSEFAAYPWVVLAVLWTIKSWRVMDNVADDRRGMLKAIGHGAMVGLMFLLIMSVKAVAEGVLLFYLWPFYGLIVASWRRGSFLKAKHVIMFCLAALLVFEGAVNMYKWENYQANGHFVFTPRGDWFLYGNTACRMQPLSLRRLGAAVAYVPGLGVCPAIFGTDDCDFWSDRHAEDVAQAKREAFKAQGATEAELSQYYIYDSIRMILSNPLQAVGLWAVEAHKIFFWESSIAFVAYPDWLEGIFYAPGLMNSLKIVLALFSWGACVFSFCYLCFYRRAYWRQSHSQVWVLFWVLNFIFWFAAMYSVFFVIDRYAFPLVSLFLVLLAFMVHKWLRFFVK